MHPLCPAACRQALDTRSSAVDTSHRNPLLGGSHDVSSRCIQCRYLYPHPLFCGTKGKYHASVDIDRSIRVFKGGPPSDDAAGLAGDRGLYPDTPWRMSSPAVSLDRSMINSESIPASGRKKIHCGRLNGRATHPCRSDHVETLGVAGCSELAVWIAGAILEVLARWRATPGIHRKSERTS